MFSERTEEFLFKNQNGDSCFLLISKYILRKELYCTVLFGYSFEKSANERNLINFPALLITDIKLCVMKGCTSYVMQTGICLNS